MNEMFRAFLVFIGLLILLIVLSLPGHVVSMHFPSTLNNIIVGVSIVPVVLLGLLVLVAVLSLASFGWSESGPTELFLILAIEGIIAVIAVAYERWGLGHTLYGAAAQVFAILALIHAALFVLLGSMGLITLVGVVYLRSQGEPTRDMRSVLRPFPYVVVGILLLGGMAALGFWLTPMLG